MSDRKDLPTPNATTFETRVRETLMTYLGRTGDPLDRGVTLRDLLDSGLAKLRPGRTLTSGSVGGSSLPILPVTPDDEPDLTPPPTPTGFTVSAAISHIFIEHDTPDYTQGRGHLRTRVYGKIVQGVIRSTFVVAPDGTLSHALYNVKATGHVASLRGKLGL